MEQSKTVSVRRDRRTKALRLYNCLARLRKSLSVCVWQGTVGKGS